MPCNSLSKLIHSFALSQQRAWQDRREKQVVEAVATIFVDENERVGFNRSAFGAAWASLSGTGFVATYIRPRATDAIARWRIVESSLRVECQLRAAFHFYPYLGARCKYTQKKKKLGNFAQQKIADARSRASDAKKELLKKMLTNSAPDIKKEELVETDFPPETYEPLRRLDALGSDVVEPGQKLDDTPPQSYEPPRRLDPFESENPIFTPSPTTRKYRSNIVQNDLLTNNDSSEETPAPSIWARASSKAWDAYNSWFDSTNHNHELDWLGEYNSFYAPTDEHGAFVST